MGKRRVVAQSVRERNGGSSRHRKHRGVRLSRTIAEKQKEMGVQALAEKPPGAYLNLSDPLRDLTRAVVYERDDH